MEAIKNIGDFFQNEILGMAWLKRLIVSVLNALGLDTDGKIGGSVSFFIYDMFPISNFDSMQKCSVSADIRKDKIPA